MSVKRRETKKGPVYDVRVRAPDGRTSNRALKTKKQAEAYERELLRSRDRGEWVDRESGRMTLSAWSQEWQRTIVHLRPSTRRIHADHLRLNILPSLGSVPLAKLTPMILRSWLSELMSRPGKGGKPLSASYVHQAYRTLRQVLGDAVTDQRLARNPLVGVKPPRPDSPPMRTLTADEVAVLAEVIDPSFRAFVLLAGWCGLRVGEMLALRWDRVDLVHRTVSVVEQLGRDASGTFVARPPKTSAAKRTIAIPRFVANALEDHLMGRLGGSGKNGLVFVNSRGGPVDSDNFRARTWQPAVRKANLDPLRIHDLRHTCASLAISANADILSLQRMLGHASPAITLNRYAHLMPGQSAAVADRLDALAAGSRASAVVVEMSAAR